MGNILLRQGTGEDMNRVLEDLFNTTVRDFGREGIFKTTENNGRIVAGARKVITGINVAQYFMVEPLVDELLRVLPKPEAKKAFINICMGIGNSIGKFYEPGEANNALEVAVHHNREKLRKLGIPERNFGKYGGEWPEEVYMIGGEKNGN